MSEYRIETPFMLDPSLSDTDLVQLANNLVALSQLALAAGDTLDNIDINPFIALPADRGGGCAVDAVIVGTSSRPCAQA